MKSIVSRDAEKKKISLDIEEKRKALLEHFKKSTEDIDDDDFVTLLSANNKPKNKKTNDEPLNLSKFLNIIDGIPERTGQILIFNTNYPDKLDPALIRPGRVDCLIHFQPMNAENSYQLITNYFDNVKISNKYKTNILNRLDKIGRFWTPAEIFQTCAKFNNLEKTLKYLENREKKDIKI